MRIGVLGSTGQIGRAIVDHLGSRPDRKYSVRAAVRAGRPSAFGEGVEQIPFDSLTPGWFEAFIGSVDHVIYAIGIPEQWVPDPGRFRRVNVDLLSSLLLGMSGHRGKSMTYISTFEVFSPSDGTVRESHPLAAEGATPYYQSMLDAYRMARDRADAGGIPLLSIHPAAVYGGVNTGMGMTDYLLNLKHRRFWRVPAVPPGGFPLVHVASLADGIERAISLGRFGECYLFADDHVSLRSLAGAAREVQSSAYRPVELPLPCIRASVALMEGISRMTGRPPLISAVQVKYLTQGIRMDCSKARKELGWESLPLKDGIGRLFRGE